MNRLIFALASLAACSANDGASAMRPDAPTTTFALSIYAHGLRGSATVGIGDEQLVVSAGQTMSASRFSIGESYEATLVVAPGDQICYLGRATGQVGGGGAPPVILDCVEPGSGRLVINEISACKFTDDSCWLELRNLADEPADLSRYQLRTTSAPIAGGDIVPSTFMLPAVSVPAGGYIVLFGQTAPDLVAGPGRVPLSHGNLVPFWTASSGSLELRYEGYTFDYVVFARGARPINAESSSGPVLKVPTGVASESRDLAGTDTKSSTDFALRWATPGGPNDIDDMADTDGDGIPDAAEVPGSTFAGLDLYGWGARIGPKDVFIEIDWMQSSVDGVVPQRAALDKVAEVFSHHGYALHFDVGDLFDQSPGLNPAADDLGGGEALAPWVGDLSFEGATDADAHVIRAQHFDVLRSSVFHYVVSGNGAGQESGRGEIGGNLFILELGGLFYQGNLATSFQALTLMHELGHNLGLDHGGDEPLNYKPNYLSVMNYLYVYGLPIIGSDEGDRYLVTYGCRADFPGSLSNPLSGPLVDVRLDFSDGSSEVLDENSVSEAEGLGRSGSAPVDFDCNGVIAPSTTSRDLNVDGVLGILHDFDDWSFITNATPVAKRAAERPGVFAKRPAVP